MGGQALIANFVHKPVTIGTGATGLSDGVACRGMVLLGVAFPAAWTAASITFQVSFDGGITYNDLYDEDNNEITWSGAGASKTLLAGGATALIGGMTHLKVRSGVTATPVAQAAERSLTLMFGVPNP